MKKLPDFLYEKKLWNKNFEFVAGVDEVGKGCFAGPLVTGCVIFNKQISKSTNKQMGKGVTRDGGHQSRGPLVGGFGADEWQDPEAFLLIPKDVIINDSKQVKPRQREKAAQWIKENALAWGIGQASVSQINRLGITKAAEIAFRKAIKSCGKVDFLLIDAFYIPFVKGLRRKNQKAIIKGDTKSISIAAASIIAKVYRDNLMLKLSKRPKYAKYGWGRNKGYGTREHQTAIKKYGITRQHRKVWISTWEKHQLTSRPVKR